ncbi:MAG: hypothetical protein JW844_01600 [Candidatus Omnitrophica bacterium]|nr:hypothetical protein [Candidatus Omnitrophota bacterium]
MVYLFLFIGFFTRLLPHAPNVTPIVAISLFGGTYLSKKTGLLVPLAIMVMTDLVLGLHEVVWFTWGSVALISLLGFWIRRLATTRRIASGAIISSTLFFLITNVGVWMTANWYSHDLTGLIDCFYMALPFYRNQLLGDALYVTGFFGAYHVILGSMRRRQEANQAIS